MIQDRYLYIIGSWFLFPSFAMVMFSFSSFAAGMLVISLSVIFFKSKFRIKRIFLCLIFVAVFSAAFSYFILDQPANLKQVLSIAGLFICGVGISQIFDDHIDSNHEKNTARWIKKFYFLLVFIGFIGIFIPLRIGPYESLSTPVFPFSEPSHFALVYAPIACLALLVCHGKMRIYICIISLAFALLTPSLTILIVTVLLLLLALSINNIILLGIAVFFSISSMHVVAPDLLDYFMVRLSSDSSENLSRLVYTQGWENMFSAFLLTSGFGIGFQNFGNEPPGPSTLILDSLHDSALNRADGGFLMAKIVGEFGVVGFMFVLFLLITSIVAGYILRRRIQKMSFTHNTLDLFPLCAIYMLIVELFFRGVGYFSPSLLFAIFCLPSAIKLIYKKQITI